MKKENKAHENDPNWKKKRTKAAPALVYEEIAGVYQQSGPPLTEAEKRDMLKEYAEGWQERNPKMALVGIYYHADEEGKDPASAYRLCTCWRGISTRPEASEQSGAGL